MFGSEDFALDLGLPAKREGEAAEMLYARSAIVVAAVSAGKLALDGIWPDIKDTAGSSRRQPACAPSRVQRQDADPSGSDRGRERDFSPSADRARGGAACRAAFDEAHSSRRRRGRARWPDARCAGRRARATNDQERRGPLMNTFAFMHGAGDDGWYWHLVEAELARPRPSKRSHRLSRYADDTAGIDRYVRSRSKRSLTGRPLCGRAVFQRCMWRRSSPTR